MTQPNPKERSTDRVLEVKAIDGKPLNSSGMLDKRLFDGTNKLHGKMEPETCLWYLEYENGPLPEALKARFTNFRLLKEHAERYFQGRNVEIVKVQD